MNSWSWLRNMFSPLLSEKRGRQRRSTKRARPVLEVLEDRFLPALITVTSLADNVNTDGQVTLREAIQAANTDTSVDGSTAGNGVDTIVFAPTLAGGTINLSLVGDDAFGPTALLINSPITIQGLTGNSGITIARDSAVPNLRLFHVASGGDLTLDNLTLSGGNALGGDGSGGGYNGSGLGGAIFNEAGLNLQQSTLSGNTASGISSGAGLIGEYYNILPNSQDFTTLAALNASLAGQTPALVASSALAGATFQFEFNGSNFPAPYDSGANNLEVRWTGKFYAATAGVYNFDTGSDDGSMIFIDGQTVVDNNYFQGVTQRGGSVDLSAGFHDIVVAFYQGGGGYAIYADVSGPNLPYQQLPNSLLGSNSGSGIGSLGGSGGAIFNYGGSVAIANSTLAGNTAQGEGSGQGGGLFNYNGTVTIGNSTIDANTADQGGGIYNLGDAATATLNLSSSIVANSSNGATDFVGQTINDGTSTTAGTNNLIGSQVGFAGGIFTSADPNLGALANNGGPTQTMALLSGSPALDSGINPLGLTADQLGSPRNSGEATDIGAFEYAAPIPPPVAHFGNALALDGNGSYAEANSVVPTSGDFTVSVWVKTDGSQNDLVEFVSQGTSGNAFYIGRESGDIRAGDGWYDTGVAYPTDGQWHNVAVVNTATTAYLYLDGNLVAIHGSLPNPVAGAFRFGQQYGDNQEYLTGDLDEVQVWNRALTQAEIQIDMTGPLTGNPSGLVGYWQFDEPSGTTAVDATGSGNDAFLINNATRVVSTLGPIYQTNENTPLSGTLDAHGGDGNALTFSIVANGGLGTATITASGAFTYTPNANVFGSDTFSYKVNDGNVDSNVVTVSITVNHVNQAPVAVADSYVTNEDTPLSANVMANDSDVDGDPLNAILVTGPSQGVLTLNADGSFIYTPIAYYSGSDSFTYAANDEQLNSNVSTVSLTINHVNHAPVAVADSYATNEDTPVSANVLANDFDVDNDALNAILVTGPSHGTLTLDADGSFTYTPTAYYHGSDSFTYRANDGQLDSNVATVSFTINLVADTPTVTNAVTYEDTTTTSGLVITRNAGDGPEVTNFKITNINGGTLYQNDGATVINNGDFLTVAQAGAGLKFAPFANLNSASSVFRFDVQASQGASDNGLGGAVVTAHITVKPVADTPSVTGSVTQEDVQTTSGLVIARNSVDGIETTFFRITNIQGGTLYQNDGQTVIQNGDFIAASQGGAGLKFAPVRSEYSPGNDFRFDVQAAVGINTVDLGGSVVTAFITVYYVAPNVAPADHFVISTSDAPTDAGTLRRFEVIAVDADGNRVTAYHGTVHITSNDPLGVLPADYTFTDADRGDAVFFAGLNTAGERLLTVTDLAHPTITGSQSGLIVRHGAATQFVVTGFPDNALVGSEQTFTVTAEDSFGNLADDYLSVVHFTTLTSALADSTPDDLPADYDFQPGDDGSHTFTITLNHGGYNFIRATDVLHASITGTETVRAKPVLDVTGGSVVESLNRTFTVATVTITDADPEPLTDYQATIHWGDGTGSDAVSQGIITAVGPGEFTVTGTHTYHAVDTYLAYVVVTASGKRVKRNGDFDVVVLEPAQSGTVQSSVVGRITREQVEAAAQGVPIDLSLQAATDGLTSEIEQSSVGPDGAALFMAHYGDNPTGSATSNPAATASFYDLRVTGLGDDARLTTTFSYPPGASAPVELRVFDPETKSFVIVKGSTQVKNSYVDDPVKRTIRVTFDRSSLPRLTSLAGTVFTIAVAPPPLPPISAPPADPVATNNVATTQIATIPSVSSTAMETGVANALASTNTANTPTTTSVTVTVSQPTADRSSGDSSGSRRTVTFETSSELSLSLTATQDSGSAGRDERPAEAAPAPPPAEGTKPELEQTQHGLKGVLEFLRDFRMPVEHGTKTGALDGPIGDWLLPAAAVRPDVEVTDQLFAEADFEGEHSGAAALAALSLLGGVWYGGVPFSRERSASAVRRPVGSGQV